MIVESALFRATNIDPGYLRAMRMVKVQQKISGT